MLSYDMIYYYRMKTMSSINDKKEKKVNKKMSQDVINLEYQIMHTYIRSNT